MRKSLFTFALLMLAAQAHADISWSHLWRNADQRGEALLQRGNAKAAAKEYADPRRKGYAEFKAGNYAAAAHDLSAADDSESHYNRGNALAYAGDLQEALNAYDAALKRDPHNQDARHNRDLVAKALKQQQKDAKKNGSRNGKQDSSQGGKQDSKQDGKQSNKQDGKQGGQDQSQSPAQNSPQPGKSDGNSASEQNKPATPSQQGKEQAAEQADSHAAQKNHGDKLSDAEQAKRDAEASMQNAKQDQASGAIPGDDANGKGAKTAAAPLTEKQIAQDQWLRSIPDDPGGLLRRKFLLQHMIRHQSEQQ